MHPFRAPGMGVRELSATDQRSSQRCRAWIPRPTRSRSDRDHTRRNDMSAPTAEEIRTAVERHVELWNAGDKEAWLAHWKRVVPGEVTMEDPVGTPLKRGWRPARRSYSLNPDITGRPQARASDGWPGLSTIRASRMPNRSTSARKPRRVRPPSQLLLTSCGRGPNKAPLAGMADSGSDLLEHESGWRDLNPRPLRPERSALPSCATPRVKPRQRIAPVCRGAKRRQASRGGAEYS